MLDVVLPNAQSEIDAAGYAALRNVPERLEVLVSLGGRQVPARIVGELGKVDPEGIGRSKVIGLVREYQVEAIEAVARQHRKVLVPVFVE